MDTNEDPDALRLLKWGEEADAWVHGYWEWCGKKRLLLRRFLNETPSFAKTGSGQAYGRAKNAATSGVFPAGIPWPVVVILAVRKTPLFAPIYIYINDHFTKTGSGQT